jgi:hypothetical protein
LYSLYRFKPWTDYPESTFGRAEPYPQGGNETQAARFAANPQEAQKVVAEWEVWEKGLQEGKSPSQLQAVSMLAQVDLVRENKEESKDRAGVLPDMDGAGEDELDIDGDEPLEVTLRRFSARGGKVPAAGEQEIADIVDMLEKALRKSANHNFQDTVHEYPAWLETSDLVKEMWDSLKSAHHEVSERPPVQRGTLNLRQGMAHDRIVEMVLAEKDVKSDTNPNILLLIGEAGTGKSYTIDAVTTTLQSFNKRALRCTATGKSAVNIGGVTLFQKDGLRIPVLKGNKERASMKLLIGEALKQFIQHIAQFDVLVIDEYTMVSKVLLAYVDSRLRQARPEFSHQPFGGMPLLICGDPAQLPPVTGSSLWDDKGNKDNEVKRQGYFLYNSIEECIILVEQNRVAADQRRLKQIFKELRDGRLRMDSWKYLVDNCSLANKSPEEKARFDTSCQDLSAVYATNAELQLHNAKILLTMDQPLARINSLDEGGADSSRADRTGLESELFLCVGCKVLLLYNLWTLFRLVNGSVGIVVDIIYAPAAKPPALPIAVIVDFPDYTGPSFFPDLPERRTWVPIAPARLTDDDGGASRTQLPLRLTWAWTPWKIQGSTIRGPLLVNLPKKEKSHGLTYVTLSRVTNIRDLCFPLGVSYERLTKDITKPDSFSLRRKEEERLERLCNDTITSIQRRGGMYVQPDVLPVPPSDSPASPHLPPADDDVRDADGDDLMGI